MAYTKTVWVNGTTPAINATNLNVMEQGIFDAQLYGADAGGDDTYVLNLDTTLVAGLAVRLKVTTGNTGACTLSIDNGATTKDIKIAFPSGLADPRTGDIPAGSVITLIYDGTYWQLQGCFTPSDIIKSFTVAEGESATAGKVAALLAGGIRNYSVKTEIKTPAVIGTAKLYNNPAIIQISTNKMFIAYGDSNDSHKGKAVIATVNLDGTITYGSIAQFYSGETYFPNCSLIDSNKVLIAYNDNSDSNKGYAIVATISGTTISYGSAVKYLNAGTDRPVVAKLDTDKAIVAYGNGSDSNKGYAVVLSVSGTVITVNTPAKFTDDTIYYNLSPSICELDTNKVLIAWTYNNTNANAIVATVSGTAISYGTKLVVSSDLSYSGISCCKLSTTSALVAYSDFSTKGNCTVLSISGTTITAGSQVTFKDADTDRLSCAKIDNNRVVIAFSDGSDNSYGKAIVGNVVGTAITFETEYTFVATANTLWMDVASTGIEGKSVIVYGVNTVNLNCVELFTTNDIKRCVGIIQETKVAGETCSISLGIVVAGLTGLTAGDIYYAQSDGSLSTTPSNLRIGVASSTTELILSLGYYET